MTEENETTIAFTDMFGAMFLLHKDAQEEARLSGPSESLEAPKDIRIFRPYSNVVLDRDEDELHIYNDAILAAETTKKLTGFNLLKSPRYIEHMVVTMMGLQPTEYRDRVDGIDDAGFRYEVKCASISNNFRYTFQNVTTKKKADFYILVGTSGHYLNRRRALDFFVLRKAWVDSYQKTKTVTPDRYSDRFNGRGYVEVLPGYLKACAKFLIEHDEMQVQDGEESA